jgi:UDP-N-acetylmuramoyl-tripeptide--D-alanyl-D-alanine ligase
MIENKAHFSFEDLYIIFGKYALHNVTNNTEVVGISIDTRTIKKGNAFFAIKGENSDGHQRVLEAFKKGASLAFVTNNWYQLNSESVKDFPVITVRNSYWGLGELANYHRNRFNCQVVAVAGSNGKTTTKELIACVLSKKNKVLKTYKNYNNQLGVPLMLFQLDETYDAAVIEIATNSFGEIAALSKTVEPNHAIITNINKEHLEQLIDLDGVEIEETNLFAYAKKQDIFAYLNLDDERLKKYKSTLEKVLTYGFTKEAYIRARVEYDENLYPSIKIKFKDESVEIKSNVIGYPGAINSLAAACVGFSMDITPQEIKNGIESYIPDDSAGYGRLSVINIDGIKIINDTYNANPGSVSEMIKLLNSFADNISKHIVLGDMLELGVQSLQEHKEIIEKAEIITKNIYTFGNDFKKINENYNFSDKESLTDSLKNNIKSGDVVLVKGSRGMKMEEVVSKLVSNFQKS